MGPRVPSAGDSERERECLIPVGDGLRVGVCVTGEGVRVRAAGEGVRVRAAGEGVRDAAAGEGLRTFVACVHVSGLEERRAGDLEGERDARRLGRVLTKVTVMSLMLSLLLLLLKFSFLMAGFASFLLVWTMGAG